MTNTEALEATTTRPVTFSVVDSDKVVRQIEVFPAGTAVYVGRIRNGFARCRVQGTLFRQNIALTSLNPNA